MSAALLPTKLHSPPPPRVPPHSEVVFTALLSIFWLHRSLTAWHWGGIAGCVVRPSARPALPCALSCSQRR